MKRSQLKALVKECEKIILEEGLLKTIVTEVAEGLNAGLVVESRQAPVLAMSKALKTNEG